MRKLVEDDESDIERYIDALGRETDALERFKRGVKAYIRWAHTDSDLGAVYDEADIRRISRATSFEQVVPILAKYETKPSFLSMVADGYF